MAEEEKKDKKEDVKDEKKTVEKDSQTDQKKGEKPDPIPYDRFKEVNDENRKMATKIKALEDEDEKRKADDAKEQGKFEELYAEEKSKRKEMERDNIRKDVALEKGLPSDFVKRLQGETKEELEADADKLLEMIEDAKKGGKGIKDGDSKKSDSENLDIDNMSPEEIRKNRDKLMQQ